jgi:hypothetical protein
VAIPSGNQLWAAYDWAQGEAECQPSWTVLFGPFLFPSFSFDLKDSRLPGFVAAHDIMGHAVVFIAGETSVGILAVPTP